MTTIKSTTDEIDESEATAFERRQARQKNPEWKRKLAWFSRWLHTYLSMASFLIVLFFAVTGWTLNHADRFGSQAKTSRRSGTMDRALLSGSAESVDSVKVADYFRQNEHIKGSIGDFNADPAQVFTSFRGPGYEASIVITRATGAFEITETRGGFVAVLNDLHKGRDTGKTWSDVIDVSAIAMSVISLTGIILILFLTKRRSVGLIALALGAAACYLIYFFWVP